LFLVYSKRKKITIILPGNFNGDIKGAMGQTQATVRESEIEVPDIREYDGRETFRRRRLWSRDRRRRKNYNREPTRTGGSRIRWGLCWRV